MSINAIVIDGVVRDARASRLAALLLAALLAGCAATAPTRPAPAETDPRVLAEQGRHAEAARAWETIAGRPVEAGAPDNAARVAGALLAAAGQWLEAGDVQRAADTLAGLDVAALGPDQGLEYDLLRAGLALRRGDYRIASRLLAGPGEAYPEPLRARRERLRERLQALDPDRPDARIGALADAVQAPDFEPSAALALLIDLPLATLERLAAEHGDDPRLAPWLDLAVGARAVLLDPPRLADALDQWRVRYGLGAEVARELAEWLAAWRDTYAGPESIAVLLPGEGPLLRAGRALRDGVAAAWLERPVARRPALEFLYLDPAPGAAVGGRFAALENGHELVIGPLARDQVGPLLDQPAGPPPTLLLNRPEPGIALPRPAAGFSILALPPEEEAELAAVRALVNEFERAVLVLQPGDYGRRVGARFAETFELGGGRVLARTEYRADEFDHTERLAELLEVDRSEQRIAAVERLLGEPVESEPQRRTDIDLVFVATRGRDGLQLLPQLRFLDIDELAVYSTSDIWPGGEVGRDLDGVEFAAAPWLLERGRPADARRRAEALFPELAGAPTLSLLHALGRDALALAPWLSMMAEDPALYLPGAVGRLRLADGVTLQRDLPWARIVEGRPRRVEPTAGD